MYNDNILTLTDSYKPTHWPQYPEGSSEVFSYLESRGGKFDNTVFYGLQYFLKQYLVGEVVTEEKIQRAKLIFDAHIGPGLFNEKGWRHILEKHNGRLPLKIRAVPEGTVVGVSNSLMTVVNTDPEVPWLTNYLESLLLQTWYPTTVATLSREVKKVIINYLKKTTSYDSIKIKEIVSFMLHDFGFRGVSSVESAGLGGSAHLINFMGSDTISAVLFAQEYYNTTNMLAYSIPASEHSTITSWTEPFEVDAMENMLDKYPTGMVACVSDSYNIIRACRDYWGTKLKDKILNRNGRLIIRPDSGDPAETLRKVFNILWEKFGGHTNEKGFKVIDDHVRVIQGDGVNYESIQEILDMMVDEKFSVENIAFGMGGALLQKVDRDTQKFAFKCSSIIVNGKEIDVRKNPMEINEKGELVSSFKQSKSGKLKLVLNKDLDRLQKLNLKKPRLGFSTLDEKIPGVNGLEDQLVDVFENGKILREWTFEEVRQRADIEI